LAHCPTACCPNGSLSQVHCPTAPHCLTAKLSQWHAALLTHSLAAICPLHSLAFQLLHCLFVPLFLQFHYPSCPTISIALLPRFPTGLLSYCFSVPLPSTTWHNQCLPLTPQPSCKCPTVWLYHTPMLTTLFNVPIRPTVSVPHCSSDHCLPASPHHCPCIHDPFEPPPNWPTPYYLSAL
jgi:hypothetical protein